MIEFQRVPDSNVAEITVDGKASREEIKDVTARLKAMIELHGTVRIIEVIKSFGGMDPASLWDDIKFSLGNLNNFERCAVVSDEQWIEWWAKGVAPFLKCEVRHFKLTDLDAAREWTMGE